jgi:hypothetical protein
MALSTAALSKECRDALALRIPVILNGQTV